MPKILIFLTLIVSIPLYAASKEAPKKETKKRVALSQLLKMKTEFLALSKENQSCTQNSDCTSLPLGQKLCGGPKMFVVLSKKGKDFKKLKELSSQHVSDSEEYNRKQKKNQFGTCSVVTAPVVECNKRLCQRAARQIFRKPMEKLAPAEI